MGKVSGGPKDTNSTSEQFESRTGIQCHPIRKAKNEMHEIQNS